VTAELDEIRDRIDRLIDEGTAIVEKIDHVEVGSAENEELIRRHMAVTRALIRAFGRWLLLTEPTGAPN
jgi:hypothetical protein